MEAVLINLLRIVTGSMSEPANSPILGERGIVMVAIAALTYNWQTENVIKRNINKNITSNS